MCYLESSGEDGFQWSRTAGGTSLVAQTVNKLSAKQETQVQSLNQEDLQEKGMATHSSILAWSIPWLRNLVGYSPWGCYK